MRKRQPHQRRRVGTPTSLSLHDKGLPTVIDRAGRDAAGRQLSYATRLNMLRLRKWNIRARVHSSADRNLSQAMADINRLADVHSPEVINRVVEYLKNPALKCYSSHLL